MKKYLLYILAIAVSGIASSLASEAQPARLKKEKAWEYWRKPELYIQTQAETLFDLIDQALDENRPVPGFNTARELALYSLDALVHDTANDNQPPFHDFMDSRVSKVLADLEKPVKKGIRIYKIYNDGFIVRSKSTTVAIDLCGNRGKNKVVPDDMMQRLVDACDGLFITHQDPDHADKLVVTMFLEGGKPVYATDTYWKDNGQISRPRTDGVFRGVLPLGGGKTVKTIILPSHQDEMQDNNYVLQFPEGYTVAHLGDQDNKEDMEWIRKASANFDKRLDVLIIDCWSQDLEETVLGYNPKFIVSGHEDELGHGIDHREAYWMTFYKYATLNLPQPFLVMGWGEWYDYM